MKVLLIHHSILPDGFVPMGLSVLSAVLKKESHMVEVFDTFFYYHKDKLRVLSPLFKSVKDYSPISDVFEEFKKKIIEFKPDLVGFTATDNEMPMIKKLIRITDEYSDAYIILGGAYPTTVPEKAIKIKAVDAVCIGEGEEAVKELLEKLRKKEDIKDIKNLWIKHGKNIQKNTLRNLIDINELPFMDYSIMGKDILVKPFLGKEYISAQVEMTRGCPYQCAYCINSYLHKLYNGLGQFFRRKKPERMIDEMIYLKDNYNLEFIRFGDENFLGQTTEELKVFAELYNQKINLPFIIATRPETITREKMDVLKTIPCKQVSLGIEHGDEEFRKKVLNRHCTNESIMNAFNILKEYNIRSGAYLMIGFPTETEELIRKSFDFVLKVKPDIVAVYFFRPYDKTPLMEMCKGLDLLKKGNANYFTGSVVKGIPFRKLKKFRDDFYKEFKAIQNKK